MNRILKNILSLLLALIMIFIAVPFGAFAAENEASVTQSNNNVTLEATNSLGDMLTESLDTTGIDPDGDYTVTDLTFEGNTATASYLNIESCNLVVAVYDETTMQMLTSEVTSVEADSVSATVTFTDALPEFFVAKAFLLDDDYAPLCKEYTSRRNTAEFAEFMALETTDFEADKVINLDESEDNNFLVLSNDVQKIKGNLNTNILASSDVETNTYIFENIDSNISSLKKGDIFHLDNGDINNLVVIKVASINVDGTTATIVAEDSSLEDIFEIVKLDSNELKYNVSTQSAESGYIAEDGSFVMNAWESTNEGEPWTKTESFPFNDEHENEKGDKVVINGSATFTLEARYKIYIDTNWAEISFILNPSAVLTITATGTLKEREIKLGHIYFPPMYGVTIGAEPVLVLSASGSITITGTLKSQIGFTFNTKDGFVNKSQPTTFKPEVNIAGEFYVGFNLSPYLSFMQAKNEALVDIKFKTEFGVTIKAAYSNDSGHKCDNCIDGDLLWSAKLDVDVAILYGLIDTSDNKNYKKDLWKKEPTKFADFYYSIDHTEFGWGECPYTMIASGTHNNLKWIITKSGELIISGEGDMSEGNYPWTEYNSSINKITIEDGVTGIGTFAFESFHGVTDVTIGDDVLIIRENAFVDCRNVENISIGSNVQTIGQYAFLLCTSLKKVVIPDKVTSLGMFAFYSCESLEHLVIGNGVKLIELGTFRYCYALKTLTIGTGITQIGNSAFQYCDKLSDVYYRGSQSKWNSISIGTNNTSLLNAAKHFNSSGPVMASVSEVILASADVEIIAADPYCFESNGVAGNSYTLLNVTGYDEDFVLLSSNLLYINQVVADDNGMISTEFLPKEQIKGSVTLLIGDFGNGTEVRVVTVTTYTPGDINLDASFDGMDAVLVACIVNGMLTEEQISTKKFELADANLDGVIDTLDVTYLENKGLYLS